VGWVLAVIGVVTYEAAVVYYNAYLPRIAPPERLGRVSGGGIRTSAMPDRWWRSCRLPFAAVHAYWVASSPPRSCSR